MSSIAALTYYDSGTTVLLKNGNVGIIVGRLNPERVLLVCSDGVREVSTQLV